MTTLKSSIIYLGSNIAEKGISFLLIPIYTYYLLPSDYGILTILQSLIGFLVIFFTLSLNGSAVRFHFDGNKTIKNWNYGNIFSMITISSVVFMIIIFLLKDLIFKMIGNIPTYPYVYLVLFLAYSNAIFTLFQQKLQMEQKAFRYAIISFSKLLLSSFFAILFLKYFHFKAEAILMGLAIGGGVILIFNIYSLYKDKLVLNLHKKLIMKNLGYSIYLIPHNLASIMMQFMDRFFIANLMNLAQAGVFSLGSQLSSILSIFTSSLNTAITPGVIKAYNEKNYSYIVNLTNILISITLIPALMFSIFSQEIIELIAPKSFYAAWEVVPSLMFYFVFQMYYFMTSSVLFYEVSATKFVAVATSLSLVFNIVLNYMFITKFGIIGASFATFISIILVNWIVIYIANKYITIDFGHLRIHIFIIIYFFIANVNFVLEISFIFKIILFLIAIISIYFYERKNDLMIEFVSLIKNKLKI